MIAPGPVHCFSLTFLGSYIVLYVVLFTFICMDIQIGWQVSGQQEDRLSDTHVYVYICLIASMLTYVSYSLIIYIGLYIQLSVWL